MNGLALPKRARSRPTPASNAKFADDLAAWCVGIKEINSRLDFRVSSRGWCYILEDKGGLLKGDFGAVQVLINDCRKTGLLPLDICSTDEGRAAHAQQGAGVWQILQPRDRRLRTQFAIGR
jgi:hypothetical protein